MNVYLVRHGAAVDLGEAGVKRDADRMLTPKGQKKTAAVARALKRMEALPERIVSSPLVRARETADILAEILTPGKAVEEADVLATDAGAKEAVAWLGKQPDSPVMLVGHMPGMATLASLLLSGGPSLRIDFKKSAACCISFDAKAQAGAGQLDWLMPPAMAE